MLHIGLGGYFVVVTVLYLEYAIRLPLSLPFASLTTRFVFHAGQTDLATSR